MKQINRADSRSIWSVSIDVLCGSIDTDHIDLPGTPASKSIMAVGDEFIEIEGKKVAGSKGADLKALLQKMKLVL